MGQRAAIYTRVSKTDPVTNQVQRQREHCEELARSCGYSVVEVFSDDGISAWRDDTRRPGYDGLRAAIVAGSVDCILATAPDRLSRRGSIEWLEFVELCGSHDVKMHTMSAGVLDPRSEMADVVAFFQGRQARGESSEKSARQRRGQEKMAAAGIPRRAGARPFGWSREFVRVDAEHEAMTLAKHPVEAPLLVAATKAILAGQSLGGIVRQWNDGDKVATTRRDKNGQPGRWTNLSVNSVLIRPSNAGFRVLRGEIVNEADGSPVIGLWPALVGIEEWRAAVSVLTARDHGITPYARHLLSGLARCCCGEAMRAATSGSHLRVYRCSVPGAGVQHSSVREETADAVAVDAVVRALVTMPAHALHSTADTGALAALTGKLETVRTRAVHPGRRGR